MSQINTNIPSVIAQSNLQRNNKELSLRLERLSTGLRINRGADDPAGLIISERIRSDIQGVNQGIKNSERASSVVATTEAALAEVNDLLNSIRSLIVESASTGANSPAERDANQLQIDSAIESITRISNTASFGGLKLLNGGLDYTLSGVRTSAITLAKINNASFTNQDSVQVSVDVVASAQRGALFFRGGTPAGVTLSAMTLEIRGPKGVQVISVASGQQPLANLVNAVNQLREFTGVEAGLINNAANSGLTFRSSDFGSDALVSVRRLDAPQNPANDSWQLYKFAPGTPLPNSAPFDWTNLISNSTLTPATQDNGQDVIALVNGNLATGRGLNVSINSPSLGLQLTLNEGAATRPNAAITSFFITGGGALFQLGPEVTVLQQVAIGIPSVAASKLGGVLVGGELQFLSSLKEGQTNSIENSARRNSFTNAQQVLSKAIDDITILRGRLGAFERNVVDTNVRSLQASFENLTASDSSIRDADFAFETSRLTRAQILTSATTSTLTLANQQSQQVLQLLG
jgi:flagellin